MHVKFLKVFDAITMIIHSQIYPKQSKLKRPTICALNNSRELFKFVYIDYEQPLKVTSLQKVLFKKVKYSIFFHKIIQF